MMDRPVLTSSQDMAHSETAPGANLAVLVHGHTDAVAGGDLNSAEALLLQSLDDEGVRLEVLVGNDTTVGVWHIARDSTERGVVVDTPRPHLHRISRGLVFFGSGVWRQGLTLPASSMAKLCMPPA